METKNTNDGTLDSGATSHVTGNKELFNEISPIKNKKVKVANGVKVDIIGIGTRNIQFRNEKGEENTIKLADMLYVPEINGTFLSIRKLNQQGLNVNFHDEQVDIIKNGKILTTAIDKIGSNR